jgi:hypothetical protein
MDMGNADEGDSDIYKMYEEMLQLVKDGLDTPSKELIEGGVEEEKKDSDRDDDDDEGFNDERDDDFAQKENLPSKD